MYWVVKRQASDADAQGYYRRMHKYSGPYADHGTAWLEAQKLNDQHRNFLSDDTIDKSIRRAAFEARVNYWVISDEQIAEARSNGITII